MLLLYAQLRPDLIMRDVSMSVTDGYTAARRIDLRGSDNLVRPGSFVALDAKIRAPSSLEAMWQKKQELSALLAKANNGLEKLSRQEGLPGIDNRRSFGPRAA